MENYYKILQVADFAEIEVIKASYRALSKKYHPDMNSNPDPDKMAEINEAYGILSDEEKKKEYDILLKEYFNKNGTKAETFADEVQGMAEQSKNPNKAENTHAILAIIVSSVIGIVGSYIVREIVPENGSWSFIAYTIYGGIMGTIMSRIACTSHELFAETGALVTTICMLVPYYSSCFDTLTLIYGDLDAVSMFFKATREIVRLLLGSGIIRLFFVILTPVSTYTAIKEE